MALTLPRFRYHCLLAADKAQPRPNFSHHPPFHLFLRALASIAHTSLSSPVEGQSAVAFGTQSTATVACLATFAR
jgi:hypothetical protein